MCLNAQRNKQNKKKKKESKNHRAKSVILKMEFFISATNTCDWLRAYVYVRAEGVRVSRHSRADCIGELLPSILNPRFLTFSIFPSGSVGIGLGLLANAM
jgi:hypothetical protein